VLQAQIKAWEKIIEKESKENPFFAKVIESQKKFAARAVPWREKIMVKNDTAYEGFFKKKLG
jgi:TRAP-type mannitol/chloroaromatic compound transport system substrate-binding protein